MLRAGVGVLAATAATTSYAVGIEPGFMLRVQPYRVVLPGWGARPPMTICIVADLHAGEPWMSLDRVHRIVAAANALAPDLHVVLGDLPAHYRLVTRAVPMAEVAAALAGLRAPLGRFAVLGNHDWWDDPDARFGRTKAPMIHRLLDEAGIPVLANGAQRLPHGAGVWLAGTDSMLAFGSRSRGADRLPAALAPLAADDSPAILLAHEPAMFDQVPPRVALTLSGHTHGGQVRLLGHSFVSPRFAGRHVYGHVAEGARQLVVSGGLGCSIVPVRLGVPPELTLVQVS